MKTSPNSIGMFTRLTLVTIAMIASARAEAVSDVMVGYSATWRAGMGGTDQTKAAIYNQFAGANNIAAASGSPHRMNVIGTRESAHDPTNEVDCGVMISWLRDYNENVRDVVDAGNALGADLFTYIGDMYDNGAAAQAEQPGRYSCYEQAWFWQNIVAHETGGHNFGCDHAVGHSNPTTIMLHNYCGGSQPFYSNPNIWIDGVRLLGNGSCIGYLAQGGDATYLLSTTAQGQADIAERTVWGSNIYPVVRRWQFNQPAGAAPAGTTIASAVGGSLATVRGQGATFTGSGLRLPGGTTGNTAADSIAAYLDLPNGIFSSMPNFTIEIWATPLSAKNWMRVIQIGRTTQAGDGLGAAGEYTGAPGSPAPGATDASDILGLSAATGTGSLNNQRFNVGVDGTIQSADSTVATTAGEMHHYAITFADTTTGGTVKWFRDGILIKTLDVAFHSAALEDVNVWLGRSLWSGDEMASIDYHDVRIVGTALADGQVAGNYRIGPHDAVSTLWANDAWGSSGFTSGAWEFGSVPIATRDYEIGTLRLLAPYTTTNATFPGRSLGVTGGNFYLVAKNARTTTVNDLRLNGGATIHSFGDSGTTQTLAGNISVKNGTANHIRGNLGPMIISANISGGVGGGSLLYTENPVTLTGNNTGYLGATIVGDGRLSTLKISNETQLGGAPASYEGAMLQLNRGTLETTATMTIDDANRGIQIGPSGGFFKPAAGTTLTVATPVNSPAAGSTLQTAPMDSNPIQGILTKDGAGTLELTHPNNSHNGEIIVNTGTLKVSGNGRINNGEHWMPITNNGTLDISGGLNQTLSGVISGSGTLLKRGAGTLTLGGANTYSGGTSITGGTLVANMSSSSSSMTVSSGILAGNGTIGGSLTVGSSGILSPGASLGTLHVNGNATLQAGGTTLIEVNAATDTSDVVDVSGTLTLGGTLQVVNLAGNLGYGASFKLFNAGTITGAFTAYNLPELEAGLFWDTSNILDGFVLVNAVGPHAPGRPPGVVATVLPGTQIRLDWNPAFGTTTYTVKRSTSAGGPYIVVASNLGDTTFSDGDVTTGTKYHYVVSATNAIGDGPDSIEVAVTAPNTVAFWDFEDGTDGQSFTPTGNPAGSGGSVDTVSGILMRGYNDYYGPTWTSATLPSGGTLAMNNADNHQDAYVTEGALFSWSPETWTIECSVYLEEIAGWETLISRDGSSQSSPYSDFSIQNTDGDDKFRIGFATVGGQRWVLDGNYSVQVNTWYSLAFTSDGSTLAMWLDDGTGYQQIGSLDISAQSVAQNALPGTNLAWTFGRGWYNGGFVDSIDGRMDNIRFSNGVLPPGAFVAAPAVVLPDAPIGLMTEAVSNSGVDLSWSASAGATGYYVKRATTPGGPYSIVASSTNTSFSDTGLITGTTYYYVVSAVGTDGVSPDSNESAATPPQTLTATTASSQVDLSWETVTGATSYIVRRSTASGGPYTNITTTSGTSFADTGVLPGIRYFYVVAPVGTAGTGGNSVEATVVVDGELHVYLPFDETTGTVAADRSGFGRDGTLTNGPVWTTGWAGNAVDLDGSNDHVALPAGVVSTLNDFSISTWVYVDVNGTWARVFDFGSNTNTYMFLAPASGGNTIRYAITTSSSGGEQVIDGPAVLSPGAWHHVAVTLSGNIGTLYVDGTTVGTNNAMTLRPSNLGNTTQNWIGRSQWPDPYLNGKVDDFRIYNRALNATEIGRLRDTGVPLAPVSLSPQAGASLVLLAWSPSVGATSYHVKRSTSSGGPYTTIATLNDIGYSDTGLTNGTTYYYVVTAVNAAGESADPSQVSATPFPPVPAAPLGFSTSEVASYVKLTWSPSAGATSYKVKRATVSGGPYTVIGNVSGTTYTDSAVIPGTTYYYVVSAVNPTGEGDNSPQITVLPTPAYFIAHLKMDETGGTTTADDSGNGWNGTLINGPSRTTGRLDRAIRFDGSNDYATLPAGVVSTLNDCTISAWVRPLALSTWARVFDFGTGTDNWMFLSVQGSTGKPTFSIRTPSTNSQDINSSVALNLNAWNHLAVTISGNTGTIYLNGVAVGTNGAMSLKPSNLGNTTQNYLGKSQWPDPYFNGLLDEFQIRSRALTASEVAALAAPPSAPTGFTAMAGDTTVALGWNAVSGASSYHLKRATTSGGPFTIIAPNLTTTSYTDTGLTNGTTYYYVVTALNALAESAKSTQTSAMPEIPLTPQEVWRMDHFGNTSNSGNAADDADPDKDGMVNLLERAFGGDPNAADSGILPAVDPNEPLLSIIYRKAVTAGDLTFTVQESADLAAPWSTAVGTSTSLGAQDGVETIRFTAPAGAAGMKFLRVQVAAE